MKNEKKCEKLLEGFEPDFEYTSTLPIMESEYLDRVRKIKAEASKMGCDVLILHTDTVGWYHTSNSYVRYVCDWHKEGVLVIPLYEKKDTVLFSFYSKLVLWPPPGEPTWVKDIRQIGLCGRNWGRPGTDAEQLTQEIKKLLEEMGLSRGKIGLIGDTMSIPLWNELETELEKASFVKANHIISRMQLVKSPAEQKILKSASELIDIGFQAACYVCKPGVTDYDIYAAFTYAQMLRGGESGDGYQIGINPYGTHISKPYGHIVQSGDIINFYVSGVYLKGYYSQAARMIVVGETGKKQNELIETCLDAVERGMKCIRPGLTIKELNDVAYQAYIDKGLIESTDADRMPHFTDPNMDGTALKIPLKYVHDENYERMGRSLNHCYPAHRGPKCLGHVIGLPEMNTFWIRSSDYTTLEEGMTFSFHAQWFDPGQAGCILGNSVVVTKDGVEVLTNHTKVEPYQVKI